MNEFARVGASEAEIAPLIGVNLRDLEEAEAPRTYNLGTVDIPPYAFYMARAHHGQIQQQINTGVLGLASYNGGSRLVQLPATINGATPYEIAAKDSARLGKGMIIKRAEVGSAKNGAKAELLASHPPGRIPPPVRYMVMMQYAERMVEAGIAPEVAANICSIVAPDVNTGDPWNMYIYAQTHGRLTQSGLWLASAGGKPFDEEQFDDGIHYGGNPFRGDATAWTGYKTLHSLTDQAVVLGLLPGDYQPTVKVQGQGNVGAPMSKFIHENKDQRHKLTVVSDFNEAERIVRTLSVPETSQGIHIPKELAQDLVDNPYEDKILRIAEYIRRHHPNVADVMEISTDPNAIFKIPADFMVFAAMGDALNDSTLPPWEETDACHEVYDGVARIGLVPVANFAISALAQMRWRQARRLARSFSHTNVGGTICTDLEVSDNIASVNEGRHLIHDYAASQAEISAIWEAGERIRERVKKAYGIEDDVQASTVVQLGQRAIWHGVAVDSKLVPLLVQAA